MKKLENVLFVLAMIIFLVGAILNNDKIIWTSLIILVSAAGVAFLSHFLKVLGKKDGQSSIWVEPSGSSENTLDYEVDENSPWAVGLRVPYSKYLIERKELLEYLRLLDDGQKYRAIGKILTVAELIDEVESQTTFGKEYVQQIIEQDIDYVGIIDEEDDTDLQLFAPED